MLAHLVKPDVLHAKLAQSVTNLQMDTYLFLLEFLNLDVLMENTSSTEPAKSAPTLVPLANPQLNVRPVPSVTTSTNKNVLAHAQAVTSPTASESAQPAQSDAPTVSALTTAQPVAAPTSNSKLNASNNV